MVMRMFVTSIPSGLYSVQGSGLTENAVLHDLQLPQEAQQLLKGHPLVVVIAWD